MNTFKVELKKIGILLGAGACLTIVIDLYMSTKGSQNLVSQLLNPSLIIWNIFWLVYPVGVVYGIDKIKAIWHGIKRRNRIGEFENVGYNSTMKIAIKVLVAIVFSLIIGPIIGVINAITTLIKLKKESNSI